MKKKNKNLIGISTGDKAFYFIVNIMLVFVFIMTAYPLIYIISASLSSPYATIAGRVYLWPVDINLNGYKAVFANGNIVTGYLNSLFYTIVGTTINMIMTVMAAYPLSRRDFRPRNVIMLIFSFTMLFNGGIIPTYILLSKLRILHTRWAMILPVAIAVYNLIVIRTFFQTSLSQELLDAASIDGCSDIKFLLKIALPLSKAVLAVIGLFYAVGHWNSFFYALLFLNKAELYPLQLVLRDILILNTVDVNMTNISVENLMAKEGVRELLKFSVIVVASAPMLAVYPFVQKYFVRGVMIGAIKG